MRTRGLLAVAAALVATPLLGAEVYIDKGESLAIDPARGVDPRVDYASLVRYGPWDDRNYQLTHDDLALLAENEAEMDAAIPAFFRVGFRRALPEISARMVEYPLSAYNVFRQRFGGHLVHGTYYRRAVRDGERYYVKLDSEMPPPRVETGTGVVTGEVRVTFPLGAAESAVAISPADTQRVIVGTNGPQGGQRMHYSTDGGASWTKVNLPMGGTCCDPTVAWSSDGQYAYAAALGNCFFGCDIYFYRSDDGGLTWNGLESLTPGVPRRVVDTDSDREYLHVDHSPTSPYQDRIYMTYHSGNVMQFAWSANSGNTWTTLDLGAPYPGIGGDIATDRGGRIYYAWPSLTSEIRYRSSTDGGASFDGSKLVDTLHTTFKFPIPAMESREASIYVSAVADTTDGEFADSVYLAWTDTTGPESFTPANNHAQIRVAYKRTGNNAWTVTSPHELDDTMLVDRWHPFLAVGPDGSVHVIFYDTRRSEDRTAADLFYSFSQDGAATWAPPRRITTQMSPKIYDGFEFGDYNGLDMVMHDLITSFTDTRREIDFDADSPDVYVAGIVPGASMPGRIPGSRNVPGPPLLIDKSGTELLLDWDGACGDADDFAIYEGALGVFDDASPLMCSTGGATTALVEPADGSRFYLVVAVSAGSEGSYGRRSDDAERAPSSDACWPQTIGTCP